MSELILEKSSWVDNLCHELIEGRFVRQLEFNAPGCKESTHRIFDDGQRYEEEAYPGMYAIPHDMNEYARTVAALAGAGFNRGPDVPSGLLEQIEIDLSNEGSQFLEIIEANGGEEYSSYGVRVLRPEAIKATLELAYELGASSLESFKRLLEEGEDI